MIVDGFIVCYDFEQFCCSNTNFSKNSNEYTCIALTIGLTKTEEMVSGANADDWFDVEWRWMKRERGRSDRGERL